MLTVESRKYDGSPRFSLGVEPFFVSPSVVLALGRPGRLVRRWDRTFAARTWSLEYLPLDRPYNIISWFDAGEVTQDHFCNVLCDATLDGDTLRYVDLDLDVRVSADGAYAVEDVDEFERHAREMSYPACIQELALRAVDELVALVQARKHIFTCRTLGEARERLLALYA